jgi:ribosomal protein L40E
MPKGCSKCGTQNAVVARFCRGCGNALRPTPVLPEISAPANEVKCPACGALNATGAHFCAHCGAAQSEDTMPAAFMPTPESMGAAAPVPSVFPKTPQPPTSARAAPRASVAPTLMPPPANPIGLWFGAGAVAVALIAGIWWFKSPHGSVARLDHPAASAHAAAPVPAPAVTPAPMPAASEAPVAALPASAAASTPSSDDAAAAAARAKDKAARDARAKALRDQREQAASQAAAARTAELEAERQRADELRARAAAAASVPVQVPAPAAIVPAPPRTAQEQCAGRNPIAQAICEARECSRREHTDEPLCQRLRAADDKRREQN